MTDEFGTRPPACEACGGAGRIDGEQVEVTRLCDQMPRFVQATEPTMCPACGGSGRQPEAPRLRLLPPPTTDDEGNPQHV